jgi:hypothetical protein
MRQAGMAAHPAPTHRHHAPVPQRRAGDIPPAGRAARLARARAHAARPPLLFQGWLVVAGALLGLVGVGSIPGRFRLGALSDTLGRRWSALACCAGITAWTMAWATAESWAALAGRTMAASSRRRRRRR